MYIESKAPFTVCAWGTKAGKTFGSVEWLTKRAWEHGGGETMPYWWVAPIYRQAKIALRMMKQFLPNDSKRINYNKTDQRLEILTRSGDVHAMIEFRSADDPDALQGDGLSGVVVDEADRTKRDSYESLLTTLTKTQAPARIISSPKRRSWFYELCKKGMKLTQSEKLRLLNGDTSVSPDGVFYMNCPTSINPTIPRESIARMKSILPERAFRCYYLAEFPESDGIVFTGIDRIFDERIKFEANPNPGERYIASLDLAKHGDWTQLVVGSVQRRQIVCVLRWRDLGWEVSWRKALSYAQHYNTADCIIDATTYGDPILESMKAENQPCRVEGFNFTGSSKPALIQNLVLGIEKADVHIPADKDFSYCREELECYEFDLTESGHIKYGAPDGQHDDFVTALALFYHHLTHRVTPGIRIYDSMKSKPEMVQDVSDEQVSKMLAIEEKKWMEAWKKQAQDVVFRTVYGDDD